MVVKYFGGFSLIVAVAVFVTHVTIVFASTTDGTIDSTDRWAWSENAGWIDFGTSGGDVQVTDTALSGYAYGENIGWISLNCSDDSSCANNNYAVHNDGEGNLSGFAWGENTGWVSFNPSGDGVTIGSSGFFSGYAYAENIGWIVFATDHPVTTDWRSASSRNASNPGPTPGVGPIFTGPASALFGYVAPRAQIRYPDGRVVYLDDPPTASSTSSASASVIRSLSFLKNLKLYDTATDVLTLQKFLNAHGFIIAASGLDSTGSPQAGSVGHETSTFGGKTLKSAREIPGERRIAPDRLFRAAYQSIY